MAKEFKVQNLGVRVFGSKQDLGEAAALLVSGRLSSVIEKKGTAVLVLATGASQFEFLASFKVKKNVDWSKVTVFHLDEYVGLSAEHPASFRRCLRERILDEVKPGRVDFIRGDAEDPEKECERYAELLKKTPVDVACIGIGENGHIAFNDPPVADFNDPKLVKVVDLDEACRRQQVGEGWYRSLDEVPKKAISLTIPAIMSARTISCVVPENRKAKAVRNTLEGPIVTACPASILRRHPDAYLLVDEPAASLLSR